MGRRTMPNSDADPALYAFAAQLRDLRAAAGPDCPGPDAIDGVGRATVYAALRGMRLPDRNSLRKIVEAWGGDPEKWLKLRSWVETGTPPPAVTLPGVIHRSRDMDRLRRKIARQEYEEARAEGTEDRPYAGIVEHEYMNDVLDTTIVMELVAEQQQNLTDDVTEIREQAGNPSIREIVRRIAGVTGHGVALSTVAKLLTKPHSVRWPTLQGYLRALKPDMSDDEMNEYRLRLVWLGRPGDTIRVAP